MMVMRGDVIVLKLVVCNKPSRSVLLGVNHFYGARGNCVAWSQGR